MKRAFTFIELIFASTISIIVFTAIFVAFAGIWQLVRETTNELDLALQARAVRERLIFHLGEDEDHVEYDGLYTATNIRPSSDGVAADFIPNVLGDEKDEKNYTHNPKRTCLDVLTRFPYFEGMKNAGTIALKTKTGGSLLYVYLTLKRGSGSHVTTYRERFAVPIWSTKQGDLPSSGGNYGIFDTDEKYYEYP